MKNIVPFLLCALCACGTTDEPGNDGDLRAARGRLVVLGTDYTSGVVDAFAPANPSQAAVGLLVTSGDAVLKRLGDLLAVLNRGFGSNIILLDATLSPIQQVSLPNCGPHDVALLPDGRALVACYDSARMQVVALDSGAVSDGPDLSGFADSDGLPEADHLALLGQRIYVTLQRLNRAEFFSPAGTGLLAVVDATSLELIDVGANAAGIQAYDLGCTSPYSGLLPAPDGRFVVACSGAFVPGLGAVVAVDPTTGATELLADEAKLSGPPSALRLDAAGLPHVLVSYPDALTTNEMRVVRLGATVDVLYTSPGFTLAGLAIDDLGTVWVGNRSAGASGGAYALKRATEAAAPIATSLPPFDLEMF